MVAKVKLANTFSYQLRCQFDESSSCVFIVKAKDLNTAKRQVYQELGPFKLLSWHREAML